MGMLMAIVAGAANMGKQQMVFDWHKAAIYIRDHPELTECEAGLRADLEWTAIDILLSRKPFSSEYGYLSSNWATPVLLLPDGTEMECYVMQSERPDWNARTRWPRSALDIVERVIEGEVVVQRPKLLTS